ncbi:hypothetical protein WAF17_04500 [Bernardetia sp. ABR2-2B]|uniref:hypothetical protein n=1 Tax=Bernardetia sp. ABR2-2B TaxID=3127472 RepID=UPI0030D0DBB5
MLHQGKWEQEDINYLLSDWKEVVAQVQNNFTILSDIRNLQIQSPTSDKIHEEAQRYVAENGLLRIARVIPNNDIVNLQFGRIVKRSSMPNNDFYDVEEAEKYLDRIVEELSQRK